MKPLDYHPGQIAAQTEAGTRYVADKLADWVGPVADFARGADLFVLATAEAAGGLRFTVISGSPPLVRIAEQPELRLGLPASVGLGLPMPVACGGLAINLGLARRARVNGILQLGASGPELLATEAFTLCRKYMAPSVAIEPALRVGPAMREPVALDAPRLIDLVARAETTFLGSLSPAGMPDVAHRGGKPGFLKYDPRARRLSWTEYVGDGVFKSAGNIRATKTMALLAIDLETGEGAALFGHAEYETTYTKGQPRTDALVQHEKDFPSQGVMTCRIERAERLPSLLHPRERIERAPRITSRSAVAEQMPR
ncbi:MAG: pyridoxamine 5'-phosphate oxidase family protein [Rhodocyclaceae bacterium]|nr:pyridoxamine 5'-phosphate oxidase family protein [Rhodocyclaceae bacterium]